MKTLWFWLVLLGVASLVSVPIVRGADYPAKPIRIVVPFPAGSGADVRARKLAEPLARRLAQPVIVDNRPGAAGSIGAGIVSRAAADGYTLLIVTNGVLAINPHVQAAPGFDARTAFEPVIHISNVPFIAAVPSRLKVHSLADLVAQCRQRPSAINYGTSGSGSVQHIAIEQFARVAGIRMTHIPYKGESEVATALLGDQIDLGFLSGVAAAQHIESGRLRALAVTSPRRLILLPGVPTVAEQGFPFEFQAAIGLMAPAHTPKAIVQRLHRDAAQVLTAPEMRAWAEANGSEVVAGTPEELAGLLRRDYERFGELVRTLGLQPQ